VSQGSIRGDSLLSILHSRAAQLADDLMVAAEKGDVAAAGAVARDDYFDPRLCVGLNAYTPLHHGKRQIVESSHDLTLT
jgi:hypothetical protein